MIRGIIRTILSQLSAMESNPSQIASQIAKELKGLQIDAEGTCMTMIEDEFFHELSISMHKIDAEYKKTFDTLLFNVTGSTSKIHALTTTHFEKFLNNIKALSQNNKLYMFFEKNPLMHDKSLQVNQLYIISQSMSANEGDLFDKLFLIYDPRFLNALHIRQEQALLAINFVSQSFVSMKEILDFTHMDGQFGVYVDASIDACKTAIERKTQEEPLLSRNLLNDKDNNLRPEIRVLKRIAQYNITFNMQMLSVILITMTRKLEIQLKNNPNLEYNQQEFVRVFNHIHSLLKSSFELDKKLLDIVTSSDNAQQIADAYVIALNNIFIERVIRNYISPSFTGENQSKYITIQTEGEYCVQSYFPTAAFSKSNETANINAQVKDTEQMVNAYYLTKKERIENFANTNYSYDK